MPDMFAIVNKTDGSYRENSDGIQLYKDSISHRIGSHLDCIEVSVTPKQPVDCKNCLNYRNNTIGQYCYLIESFKGDCTNGSEFKPSEPIHLYKQESEK